MEVIDQKMSFKRYLLTRAVTMFGVLIATLLVTIALVGSNMDTILNKSVEIETRKMVTDNNMCKNMSADECEVLTQKLIDERKKVLGLEDRKSTRLNSSHIQKSRMPSSA